MENNITYIDIDKLVPHPQNPRKQLGDLTELADSIKANGVYQNLTVVEDGADTYKIIIGHRRHAAAKIAGLTQVPCVVTQMTERQQLETMLLENMQRSDLTVIEEAQGLQLLIDLGDSVADIAASTGFSKNKIKSRLCLNCFEFKTVEKAFQKGATLEDFVKIDRIKSNERRKNLMKYLGTQNFDYRYKEAIDAERWEKESPKITAVLSEFNAVKMIGYPSYTEYSAYKTAKTAKEVREFCQNNQEGRNIKYRFSSYSCEVTVYLMNTEEENRAKKNRTRDENDNRVMIGEYRKNLIKRFDDYIDSFIAEKDDSERGLTQDSKLTMIDCIIRAMIEREVESEYRTASPGVGMALSILGLGRNTIARKKATEFRDVSYAIDPNDPIGKKAMQIGKNPVKFLLALFKSHITLTSCSEYYSCDLSYKSVKFRKSKQPIRLIEILELIGFQTPDELKQYMDGTHPMYSEEGCAKIIEDNFDEEDIE